MRIIHLSDLHIGKSNNDEKTSRIIDWILENPDLHNAEIVVISGDLVDDGAYWQYQAAQKQVERLRAGGWEVLAAPGNHDYGPVGVTERKASRDWHTEMITGVKDYPHLEIFSGQAFIVLDSMSEEIEKVDLWGAQGKLGLEQLQKLDKMLAELAENPAVEQVILILHHHPFDFMFFHGLRDHADLKGVISRRKDQPPRVNVLLFGHKHIDKRFNDPLENKEQLYGIDIIYASGSTVERNLEGKMVVPVIDLTKGDIDRFFIH